MKNLFSILCFFALFFPIFVLAQAPDLFNYQGVARDNAGNILPNQSIGLLLEVHQSTANGTVVFSESHGPATNDFGLFNIAIGSGTPIVNTVSFIDWSNGPYFLEVSMDPAGGTNYQSLGTSQLLSVPYALFAGNSSNGEAPGNAIGDMKYWNGTAWTMIPVGTPGQFLQIDQSNIPTWSGGTFATLTTDPIVSQVYFQPFNSGGGNISNVGITSGGGSTITSYGLCWNTAPNPTMADNFLISGTYISGGAFTGGVGSLVPNTTYFVRAFAVNNAGVAYGNQVSFTTFNPTLPTVTTTAVTGVTGGIANSGGTITNDGGAPVSSKGICFSTSPSPTIGDNIAVDGGFGNSYSSIANGLVPNTTYYLRAYATNVAGTAYGNEYSFTTSANLSIGSYHQGGIIGYFLQNGDPGYDVNVLHGIIISQADVALGVEWGCYGTLISGVNGTLVGGGVQNTLDIVAGCNTTGIAAEVCSSLSLNGYNDWFLPSNADWIAVDQNLVLVNGISNQTGYWTSSQVDANSANINYNNYPSYTGYIGTITKNDVNSYGGRVRAARMF